jgi:polyisoprenoid-binding protein YceI
MKTFAVSLVLALPLLFASSAVAQRRTFTVNPNMSQVQMTLKTNHGVVHGTFHIQSGSISYDRSAPKISGSIVVAAGSGTTGNNSRDKKMDKYILKVAQYATVTFMPIGYTGMIAPTGDSTIQVSGILTLLGTLNAITIPMQIHVAGDDCTAKAHFAIPYVRWGLKNPSFMFFRAANDVDLDLNLIGKLSE